MEGELKAVFLSGRWKILKTEGHCIVNSVGMNQARPCIQILNKQMQQSEKLNAKV